MITNWSIKCFDWYDNKFSDLNCNFHFWSHLSSDVLSNPNLFLHKLNHKSWVAKRVGVDDGGRQWSLLLPRLRSPQIRLLSPDRVAFSLSLQILSTLKKNSDQTHSSAAYRSKQYWTIHRCYKITNRRQIQPKARERDTKQERDSVRRLTVGLSEWASELAMATWLDLVWRRKRGLRVWFRKRITRERK